MNDPVLQDIKDRLNVAEVIGGYITVKRAGTAFKAVCPFHSEKSASLMISPQKQIWHCFGCGAGGDIFGFVMRFENVEFKEALRILADRAGVKLPTYNRDNKQEQNEKQLLLKINNFAAQLYHRVLTKDKRGKQALEYLLGRGLTEVTIKLWQIGFAPQDGHILEQALLAKKVSAQDLVKAGVSAKNDRGIYERFYGRITFPVYNYMGEVVGFSARVMPGNEKLAKYINSPETEIYHKSKVLFGLNFAKNSIRKFDEAIIVEGQMDCIMAHQAGFTNTVASSGTALTQEQLQLLVRLTRNLKFCFDSDAAGVAATKRSAELYLGQDFNIKIISLPEAKDPADLLLNDPAVFKKHAAEAEPFLNFYIEKLFENFNDTVEEKRKIAKEVLPLLRFSQDPVEQDHYIQILAARLQTTVKVLWAALDKIKKPSQPAPIQVSKIPQTPMANRQSASLNLEKEILGGLLLFPDFLEWAKQRWDLEDFENYEIKSLLADALNLQKPFPETEENSTLAKEAIFMVESQLKDMDGNREALVRQLERSFILLKLQAIKRSQQHLNFEIKKAESLGNKSEAKELSQKFAQIAAQRLQFEQLM